MLKRMNLSLLLILLLATCVSASARGAASPARAGGFSTRLVALRADGVNDREQDGLVGSVRRVKTETAKLVSKEGKPVEGARVVLETATYDIKGAKIDNAYFLAAGGSLTGKEVYKYDDKGNIIEMSLHRDDGSLASKEVYTYEFDAVGNWTKMTTAVAILEGGKVTFEPTEVTYRSIAYFMEEATVNKLSQPVSFDKPAPPATNATSTATTPANVRTASSPSSNAPAGQSSASVTPSPSSAAQSPSSVVQSNTANQQGTASPLKANTFVPVAAATKNAPVASKKASAVNAPPELASVDNSKMYTVSNPPVGNAVNAASKTETGSASVEPQVRVEGEAPARPLARGPLKPISGGVLNGKARALPPPVYPVTAKRFRVAGVVTVEVVIDVTGKVISAKATDGPEMLHQAAEKAAMQAQFSPTLLSGQPVKISGVINYNFSLGN